jgi:hypothetical protein
MATSCAPLFLLEGIVVEPSLSCTSKPRYLLVKTKLRRSWRWRRPRRYLPEGTALKSLLLCGSLGWLCSVACRRGQRMLGRRPRMVVVPRGGDLGIRCDHGSKGRGCSPGSIVSVFFVSLCFLFATLFVQDFVQICRIFSFFLFITSLIIPWSLGHFVNILPTNENRKPAIAGSFKNKTLSTIY